jgi:hypothetical protein
MERKPGVALSNHVFRLGRVGRGDFVLGLIKMGVKQSAKQWNGYTIFSSHPNGDAMSAPQAIHNFAHYFRDKYRLNDHSKIKELLPRKVANWFVNFSS